MIDPQPLLANPPSLTTPRLALRPLALEDTEALFTVFSDPEAMRYWSEPPHETPAMTQAMIRKALDARAKNEGLEWAITRRGDERAIGKIGHWRWQREHSRSEIGFIMRRDLWRQGLASEALLAAAHFGFEVLKLHSIEAQLDYENLGSMRTLERVGFTLEGRLRQSYFDGKGYRDTLVYGLLAEELQ
jgi:ribosomal-protein-alanine N-acetyltransferase